ncbi:MAG: lysophospholipid acyltransferase family protein [Solirubrobacterales bacterium]
MREPTHTYSLAMGICRPLGRWTRLRVDGLDLLPESGPALLVGNHDSYWDPVLIGLAARGRRQVRALAKSTLWKVPGLGPVLDGMGQIPIERGAGDAAALERAISELRAGACIGIFPEGTKSRGERLRARSGVGRLALAVPEARIVLVAIEGTADLVRFPRRPRIRARFLEPGGGQGVSGEDPGALASRLLEELRELAPPVAAARRR